MESYIAKSDELRVGLGLYALQCAGKFTEASPIGATLTKNAEAAAEAPVEEKKAPSYERRDQMREMEKKIQQLWNTEHTFEVDAANALNKEKFFCTFPYPYMNGKLHLGHAFTITKADFQAGYQRLQGKHVLFPFGFHCTGMPISAAAKKLKRELENPEDEPVAASVAAAAPPPSKQPDGKFTSKKSKTSKKSGVAKTQAEILISSGIPPEQVEQFKDPEHWLHYFPPRGEDDLRAFGLLCDWRRSFITTDVNPFYDSFVRWQFRTLHARGRVIRGKRPTICTPDDGQACADHDRAEGEGVQDQEYTLIKMEMLEQATDAVRALNVQSKVYFVAATLRPETMFGQTNCYVLPSGEYGFYQVSPTEVFVCGEHAARNLAFQGYPGEDCAMTCLGKVRGTELIGTLVRAPLALHGSVRVLPMETVSMTMGTAVVTSVPSDSPDDFMTYSSLQKNDKFRATHGVDPAWVELDIVHIIDIPGFHQQPAAPQVCERLKIKSPKESALLEKAKDEVYLHGFEYGVMSQACVDALPTVLQTGIKVKEAKPLVRQYLLDTNQGIRYWEPAKPVLSRSGLSCIVKQLDQWYLPYGEKAWKDSVLEHVHSAQFNAYAAPKQFDMALDWLREWACSRSFGLGTRLPAFTSNDKEGEFVIESLSDSTLYMAYYTVCHFLQCGPKNYDAHHVTNPVLTVDMMNQPGVWDYVFLLADKCPSSVPASAAAELLKMRQEFQYWYPLDLRVSGKDLIQNHLTMSLYNHAAVWDKQPELWPRSFFTNGHILVESEKMAKSKGNFILLHDACIGQQTMTMELDDGTSKVLHVGWTADATRAALADGGDGLDDANFSADVADNAVMRLFSENRFAGEVMTLVDDGELARNPVLTFHEELFHADMDMAIELTSAGYDAMRYRDALKEGFFVLPDARDRYRKTCSMLGAKPRKQVMMRYVQVLAQLLAPICPHYAENVWRFVLKHSGSVFDGGWPQMTTGANAKLVRKQGAYLEEVEKRARTAIDKAKTKPAAIAVGVALTVPDWHAQTCAFLKSIGTQVTQAEAMTKLSESFRADPERKKFMKDAMKVAPKIYQQALVDGESAYETASAFDEVALLEMYSSLLVKLLDVPAVQVFVETNTDRCSPGKPSVKCTN